jgi:RNA polymerase sigma-70 factor (ECF subfamily)
MDLTQKVFLTVHVKLHEFEGRSAITTWLFGICQRVASDYRRSASIRREIATDASELEVELEGVAPEELVSSSESREQVRVAEAILAKIPEPQRLVFVMFELEEMSGQAIAELLNISVGTVRSRLRLAREAFRREVKRLQAAGTKEAV